MKVLHNRELLLLKPHVEHHSIHQTIDIEFANK